ncbi:MAG: 23S rRNA (adenine(2503)-C(2))-methyltransferase RlmN [Oscillospiraceae bacterium]|jgi:23S rRNA (adenine2503-C2)-methyltransferase|nr:23S rRNA (adenine(2503)-C(2))-methyltransferase RlmN [Oscillospiraceae bacterium]
MSGLIDVKSLDEAELRELILSLGMKAFRAEQIFSWLHKGVHSFEEMKNIAKSDRELLLQKCYISFCEIEKKLISEYDGTVKYLFRLCDGEYVESVLMKYHHGYSMCISTQVGCKMGCTFCATGLGGFRRNLTPSEMLAQITEAQIDNNIRISNVVLMGMGEPLDNFENVMKFLSLISSPKGVGIGQRHISVSTCGLVDRILQLADMKPQFTLSVSLHAPNDAIRSKTMPINKRWNVDSLLSACRLYANATRRRISFEYSLIKGVNDTAECAKELAEKLRGMLCHVNLIPVNTVAENGYACSNRQQTELFKNILLQKGIQSTVRRTLGADINASCGQLRMKNIQSINS